MRRASNRRSGVALTPADKVVLRAQNRLIGAAVSGRGGIILAGWFCRLRFAASFCQGSIPYAVVLCDNEGVKQVFLYGKI